MILAALCAAVGACATTKPPPNPCAHPDPKLTFLQQLQACAATAPQPLPTHDGLSEEERYCEYMEMTYGPGAGGC